MPSNLRVDEFSDRELLFAYERAATSGGATVHMVSDELGLDGVANPTQSIAMRFGWLHRYGILEKDKDGLWIPTGAGEQLLGGELRNSAKRVFDEMTDQQIYAATLALTRRLANANNVAAGRMVTRHMRYGMAQFKQAHPWR